MTNDSPSPLSYEMTATVGRTCVGGRIQTAARVLGRRYDQALRPVGLTGWQFSLLMNLNRPDLMTIGSLAAAIAMDRTTVTANLKPLQARGFVEGFADPDDGRVRRIRLTTAGKELLAKALPHWRAVNDATLAPMTNEARQALQTALTLLLEGHAALPFHVPLNEPDSK
jgi:DNA-binding MarR family transcriptional regulator